MLYFEKSQPAPDCLAKEKKKKSGQYNCGDVLARLKKDFCNKCYICEKDKITNINIDHLKPHRGGKNIDLKFDWDNLFFSCFHCNNIKSDKYDDILDCTKEEENPELLLKYSLDFSDFRKVKIEALVDSEKVKQTKELLLAVYNGTTPMKALEASNLRELLIEEIIDFQDLLEQYQSTTEESEKDYLRRDIVAGLGKASSFTAFKRWIIRDNHRLKSEFGEYLTEGCSTQ